MKDLDWELFDRYLAGVATPAEREEFDRWLLGRPDRAEFLAAWHRGLARMEGEVEAADKEAVWAGPLENVGHAQKGRPGWTKPRHRRKWSLGAGLAAAAVMVALAGRALLTGDAESAQGTERVLTVPRGEQALFRLPDGSQVLLAAGSTLRHLQSFASTARDVTLEGEAYFTVAHDARRPFRVRAGDLIATDLGTEFLVRAYPEDTKARVVVRSGEVAVRPARSSGGPSAELVVKPGELGRLGAGGVPEVEPVDTAAYFAWTEGTLVFDGTPLREALPQLSRWYDVEFKLTDSSLGGIPLSGRLGQTLSETRLDLLAGSLGLKQVRRDGVVTLSRP
jgi:ferric-dicitrate binding protein FerR (iron transport regulator)